MGNNNSNNRQQSMTRLISTTRLSSSWPPTFGVAPPWVLKLNYKIAGSRVGSHFSVASPPPTSLATLPSLSLSLSFSLLQATQVAAETA